VTVRRARRTACLPRLSVGRASLGVMRTDELLMLTAVTATCTDCGGERIFLPVDDVSSGGEFCCTSCDAAVFLLLHVGAAAASDQRVA
jgi:hypothetical protein